MFSTNNQKPPAQANLHDNRSLNIVWILYKPVDAYTTYILFHLTLKMILNVFCLLLGCHLDSPAAFCSGLWVRIYFIFSSILHFLFSPFKKKIKKLCFLLSAYNSVVEFKDEEYVKKAVSAMNKHDLSGRPLNIKEVSINYFLSKHFICDEF